MQKLESPIRRNTKVVMATWIPSSTQSTVAIALEAGILWSYYVGILCGGLALYLLFDVVEEQSCKLWNDM